jgi:hypothetical protein
MKKIAIGVIDSHLQLYKQFAFSLLGVVTTFNQWAAQQKKEKYTLDVILAEHGRIDDMRNTVARNAIDGGYDYLFWMDSDMIFPFDCLIVLLQYLENDDWEAVSGLYTHKVAPYHPHIYPKIDSESQRFLIPKTFPLDQPIIVEGAGFGCLLMRVDVFKRLKKPFFTMAFDDGKMTVGEDLDFCRKAKMRMLLDPNVRCRHLIMASYGLDDFLSYTGIVPDKDGWIHPTEEQGKKVLAGLDSLFEKTNPNKKK